MEIPPVLGGELLRALGGGERGLVVESGFTPGEDAECLIRRAPGVVRDSIGGSGLAGANEVMGDLHHVRVGADRVQTLQRLGDLPVDSLAARRTGLVVERVPDQRMCELHRRPLAPQQALAYPLVQKIQQLVVVHPADRAEHSKGHAVAEECGQGQDGPACLAQRPGARDDRPGDLIGEPQLGRRGGGDEIAALLLKRVLANEVMKNFLDEQRIALCRLADGGRQLMGRARESQAAEQLVDFELVEPREGDAPADGLSFKAGAQAGEAVLGRHGPVRANDGERDPLPHRHVGDGEHEMIEQVQGELVGPVQIVDNNEGGSALGELDRRVPDRQEELELLVVCLTRQRRVRRRRRRNGAMQQLADTLAVGGLSCGLFEEGQERVDEGEVGKRKILVAAICTDLHAQAPGDRAGFVKQPRLADSRLALHEDNARAAVRGLVEPAVQLRQLLRTADKWRDGGEGLPSHWRHIALTAAGRQGHTRPLCPVIRGRRSVACRMADGAPFRPHCPASGPLRRYMVDDVEAAVDF